MHMEQDRTHSGPAHAAGAVSVEDSAAMNHVVHRLMDVYNRLDSEHLHLLDEIYSADVLFEDPAQRIYGLSALRERMGELYRNVRSCRFTYNTRVEAQGTAMLEWTMHLRHVRFHPDRELNLPGATLLHFDEGGVYLHRDFYDLGALIYERVPLLGRLIRRIK